MSVSKGNFFVLRDTNAHMNQLRMVSCTLLLSDRRGCGLGGFAGKPLIFILRRQDSRHIEMDVWTNG